MPRIAAGCWLLAMLSVTLNTGWHLQAAGGLRLDLHVYLFDVAMIAAVGFWALSLLLGETEVPRLGPRLPACALAGLVVLSMLGTLVATHADVALGMSARLWLLFLFYLYTVNHPPSFRSLAVALCLGAFLQLPVALLQVVRQHSLGLGWIGERAINPGVHGIAVVAVDGHRWLRPYGLTVHPNVLGGLAACTLGVVATGLPRRWAVPATLCCLAVIALALSRSAMVAAAVAVLVYRLGAGRPIGLSARHRRVLIPIAVLGVALLAATPAGTVLATRFDPGNALEQQSIHARLTEMTEAWPLIAAHPVLGVGANCYLAAIEPLLPLGIAHGSQVPIVHDAYLLALAEIGFLGPLLLALALLWPVWITLRSGANSATAALAAALAACAVLGLTDYYIWSLPSFRLLWVTTLALWAAGRKTRDAAEDQPARLASRLRACENGATGGEMQAEPQHRHRGVCEDA